MDELRKQVFLLFETYHFPGHDFKHVERVSKLARKIAEAEGYDPEEAEIAGLLHDVGRTVKDPKDTHAHEGVPIGKELLDKYTSLSDDVKQRIAKSIEVHSDLTTEGKLNNIVQDADKLDCMGAMGIIRAYQSLQGIPDFDPENIYPEPGTYGNFLNVHEGISLQIKWYDMLYTDKAREIGRPRKEFMIAYMNEVIREVQECK